MRLQSGGLLLLLLSSGLGCGDSGGGDVDAGTPDMGSEPMPCPEITNPRLSGMMTINGNAYTFDCDLSEADREDILYLETPNITGGTIQCRRAQVPRYTITLDMKSEPIARTYTDAAVIKITATSSVAINLNGPQATNSTLHEVIVECWDKENLRINGSFEASFSESGATGFNGYGDISGTFSANLMQ
jgi:hypothetical protein